jgi:hypothetical protein
MSDTGCTRRQVLTRRCSTSKRISSSGLASRPTGRVSSPSRIAAQAIATPSITSDFPRSRADRRASAISFGATRTTRSPRRRRKRSSAPDTCRQSSIAHTRSASGHAGDPQTAAGDTTSVGQTGWSTESQWVSPSPIRGPTGHARTPPPGPGDSVTEKVKWWRGALSVGWASSRRRARQERASEPACAACATATLRRRSASPHCSLPREYRQSPAGVSRPAAHGSLGQGGSAVSRGLGRCVRSRCSLKDGGPGAPAPAGLGRLPRADTARDAEHALGCQVDSHAPVGAEGVDQSARPPGPV